MWIPGSQLGTVLRKCNRLPTHHKLWFTSAKEEIALDFPRHLSPLFAVHLVPVVLRGAADCFLVLLRLLDFMARLHGGFNSARPGRQPLHSLSIGVGPLFFFGTTPPPSIQSPVPEPCSLSGRKHAETIMRPSLPSLVVPQILIRTQLLDTHHTLCSYSF